MKLTYKNEYGARKFNTLLKRVEKFYNKKELRVVLKLLKNEKILKFNNIQISELFLWRGTTYYELKEYDNAINYYNTAIEFNPNYALAYYNMGTILVSVKRNYNEALKYFECAREFDKKMVSAYVSIASIYRFRKNYNKALEILNNAIKIDSSDANSFYNRGIVKLEGYVNWEESINDFKKFKELTPNSDTWVNYADYYINYIGERTQNPLLVELNQLVTKIKNCLICNESKIAHYTSLYTLKKLIFDKSKFRLSEGNFLNDPSEGLELFNFLDSDKSLSLLASVNSSIHKPFIGSFVTYSNKDDLNMWRFYGKEDGVDAKGCSISIDKIKFLYALIESINIDYERHNSLRDNIDFYFVAYYDANSRKVILSDDYKCKQLNILMYDLFKFINNYQKLSKDEKLIAQKDLISIAYLFKNHSCPANF